MVAQNLLDNICTNEFDWWKPLHDEFDWWEPNAIPTNES